MLKGIDPLLSPEALHVLAAMGHGDELVLVDRNYPAASTARRLVRLDGSDLRTAAHAVLALLPLDTFIDRPLAVMAMVDTPDVVPAVQQEIVDLAQDIEGRRIGVEHVERYAFYERARHAFAVMATSEAGPTDVRSSPRASSLEAQRDAPPAGACSKGVRATCRWRMIPKPCTVESAAADVLDVTQEALSGARSP
jgi:L-fucose mutarotase